MVVVRLSRAGRNKKPFYLIRVTDKRSPRDGRFLEELGFFNPGATGKAKALEIKRERLQHWINQGAQLSERVASLLLTWDKANSAA
jgi:small subunit ribosomal protein S16